MNSRNKSFGSENREQNTENRSSIRPPSSVLRSLEGGFPIRKFPDQSLFAAPRDLSQRTTSFIASQRQGIHQTPLRHLIALIAKARSQTSKDREQRTDRRKPPALGCPSPGVRNALTIEKTSFASNASGDPSGQALRTHDWLLSQSGEQRPKNGSSPPSHPLIIHIPDTECASSSQCQRSEDDGRREDTSPPDRFCLPSR